MGHYLPDSLYYSVFPTFALIKVHFNSGHELREIDRRTIKEIKTELPYSSNTIKVSLILKADRQLTVQSYCCRKPYYWIGSKIALARKPLNIQKIELKCKLQVPLGSGINTPICHRGIWTNEGRDGGSEVRTYFVPIS